MITHGSGIVKPTFDLGTTRQYHQQVVQRILLFPKRAERWLLEGSASEGERNGCSGADFDQMIDDQSHQLVDLDDWVRHPW